MVHPWKQNGVAFMLPSWRWIDSNVSCKFTLVKGRAEEQGKEQ